MIRGHELAAVIENFLPSFNARHKLPSYKLRTLNALRHCRTEYMGGHVQACQKCGELHTLYNSCRNRHCPKCGAIDREKWIIAREADLLPVKYFHVVFTVPDKLNELFLNNQAVMYNLLFRVGWDVLQDFGKTKKWIGGRIGAIAILHTRGQNLTFHPHLHFIVPAGALMPNGRWKHSRKRGRYLFKVDHLSRVFRARFVERVRKLIKQSVISGKVPGNLFDRDWVVYAKRPFGGPQQVIGYLGRYTHRTAISNDRILEVNDETVTFTWKDYHNNYKRQTTTLPGELFLGLFCRHILPPGFTRIRHYGFLSSASKKKSLAIIRAALKQNHDTVSSERPWQEIAFEKMGIQPGICKSCGGAMVIIEILPDHFHSNQRTPPEEVETSALNNWTYEF
jgi:hypothetical protein